MLVTLNINFLHTKPKKVWWHVHCNIVYIIVTLGHTIVHSQDYPMWVGAWSFKSLALWVLFQSDNKMEWGGFVRHLGKDTAGPENNDLIYSTCASVFTYGHEVWQVTNSVKFTVWVHPLAQFEELWYLERALDRSSAELVHSSDQDACWSPPWGSILDTST